MTRAKKYVPKYGKRIKTRREEIGYTQKMLGALTGFSQQTIAKIENGRRKLSLLEAEQMCIILQMEFLELIHGVSKKRPRHLKHNQTSPRCSL